MSCRIFPLFLFFEFLYLPLNVWVEVLDETNRSYYVFMEIFYTMDSGF